MYEDELRRPGWQSVMLAAVVMMMGAGMLFTGRPLLLSNRPMIDHVAAIPASADRAQLARYVDAYPYFVPQRPSMLAAIESLGHPGEAVVPDLGYSVREVSILGLPLFGYTELGYVAALRGMGGVRATPITDDQLATLDRQAGERLESGWFFPFWLHSWGLLGLAAIAAAIWLEFRFQAQRRELLGIL